MHLRAKPNILVVNLGSSSGKFSLFEAAPTSAVLEKPLRAKTIDLDADAKRDTLLQHVMSGLESLWLEEGLDRTAIEAVGHRIVHGGGVYDRSAPITGLVKEDIRAFEKFAPIHNRLNYLGIEAVEKLLGSHKRQIAVFDTTFHHTIQEPVARYSVPYEWKEQYGFWRYGFHGISHQNAAIRASQMLDMEPDEFTGIVCHLGNGCSVTAVQNGKSVDTSMGFTPLEGLMMGARSGSIDPGILLYLLRDAKMKIDEVSHVLNHESGLAGVSGLSNDMRVLTAEASQGNVRARLAIDMFVYRLQSYIGSYFVHLKEPKALVFTGGIGEHSSGIRQRTVAGLGNIGCMVDAQANEDAKGDVDISDVSSKMRVLVIASREDLFIAREVQKQLQVASS